MAVLLQDQHPISAPGFLRTVSSSSSVSPQAGVLEWVENTMSIGAELTERRWKSKMKTTWLSGMRDFIAGSFAVTGSRPSV